MLNISKVSNVVQRVAGRQIMVVKKYSPEILTAVGIVGFGATVVTACSATLKVDDILTDHKEQIEKIDSVAKNPDYADEYSETDATRDKAIVYIQTGTSLVKNYLPSITLGALSIGCILCAHNIMSKRNVALLAAYKASEEAFANYRENVKEELGEEKDHQFLYGLQKTKIEEIVTDDKGKEKKVKKEVMKSNGRMASQYARFFDETNRNWNRNPEANMNFLILVQNQANDLLVSRNGKPVFLNEVYDMLDLERSEAGQFVGWALDENGDGYIDFNIFDGESFEKREFVNGYNPSILLDFNVDGVVHHLI